MIVVFAFIGGCIVSGMVSGYIGLRLGLWAEGQLTEEKAAELKDANNFIGKQSAELLASEKTAASFEGRYNALRHRMEQQDAYVADLEKVAANSMQSVLVFGSGGPAAMREHREKSDWICGKWTAN